MASGVSPCGICQTISPFDRLIALIVRTGGLSDRQTLDGRAAAHRCRRWRRVRCVRGAGAAPRAPRPLPAAAPSRRDRRARGCGASAALPSAGRFRRHGTARPPDPSTYRHRPRSRPAARSGRSASGTNCTRRDTRCSFPDRTSHPASSCRRPPCRWSSPQSVRRLLLTTGGLNIGPFLYTFNCSSACACSLGREVDQIVLRDRLPRVRWRLGRERLRLRASSRRARRSAAPAALRSARSACR